MPRMRTVLTLARFVDEALQRGGTGAGAAAGAEVQKTGGLPRAALGGALQIEQHGAGGVVRRNRAERGRDAAEDDGQLVVEVMSSGGGDGADAVGSRKAFHATGYRDGLRVAPVAACKFSVISKRFSKKLVTGQWMGSLR